MLHEVGTQCETRSAEVTGHMRHDNNRASARTSCSALVLGEGLNIVIEEISNGNKLVKVSIVQEVLQ